MGLSRILRGLKTAALSRSTRKGYRKGNIETDPGCPFVAYPIRLKTEAGFIIESGADLGVGLRLRFVTGARGLLAEEPPGLGISF